MSGNKKSIWGLGWLAEFFQDSRKNLSVFTLTSLAAGATLVYTGIIEVNKTGTVQREIIYSLFFIYCVSVISDNLLGAVIERGIWTMPPAPDTQVNAVVNADNMNVVDKIPATTEELATVVADPVADPVPPKADPAEVE